MYLGVDVGLDRLHCVAIDADGALLGAALFTAAERSELQRFAQGALAIAIDSPSRWSTSPHAASPGLPPKFARARCAEIALKAPPFSFAVPFTTPETEKRSQREAWMATGIQAFLDLEAQGQHPIEVYPYAAFRSLNPGALPPKATVAGLRARQSILEAAGLKIAGLAAWGHDGLDAAAAALVARDLTRGRTQEASHRGRACDDGSRIYLPAPLRGA